MAKPKSKPAESKAKKLTDQELDKVAGGIISIPPPTVGYVNAFSEDPVTGNQIKPTTVGNETPLLRRRR